MFLRAFLFYCLNPLLITASLKVRIYELFDVDRYDTFSRRVFHNPSIRHFPLIDCLITNLITFLITLLITASLKVRIYGLFAVDRS